MRHRGSFQSLQQSSDGQGGFVDVWVDISTNIPVEILPISVKVKAEMNSLNVLATHYIRTRASVNVDEVGRFVWSDNGNDRYFYIDSVENIQYKDKEFFIVAEERRL